MNDIEHTNKWDLEDAVRRKGVKKARAVVSVAFSREEFEDVKASAERLNMKLSEFIRKAALEKARQQSEVTSIVWFGSSEGAFNVSAQLGPLTQATPRAGSKLEEPSAIT